MHIFTVFLCLLCAFFAEMAPPIENAATKTYVEKHAASLPPLNERILSSMSQRSVAAHPWHDLEIGKAYT